MFSHIFPKNFTLRGSVQCSWRSNMERMDQFTDPIEVKAFGTAVDRGAGVGMQQRRQTLLTLVRYGDILFSSIFTNYYGFL